jgi:hypothetical protein
MKVNSLHQSPQGTGIMYEGGFENTRQHMITVDIEESDRMHTYSRVLTLES